MAIILPRKGETTRWTKEIKVDGDISKYLDSKTTASSPKATTPVSNPTNAPIAQGFIYVPSLGLYVAKTTTHKNKNWYDCHKSLQAEGSRMPTIPEFIGFLNYLRANPQGVKDALKNEVASILDEILTVRDPYRAEWLDADFKTKGKLLKKELYINFNHELKGDKLVPKNSEKLEDYLAVDQTPGIDLESWLNNPTKHGLPKTNVKKGDLYYWAPMSDNNSVAWFDADSDGANLYCYRNPSNTDDGLGVRAIRHASP